MSTVAGAVTWKPMAGEKPQPPSSESLWKTLLAEAAASRTKLPHSTLLFLGDASAGKTSLVERFCVPKSVDEEDEQQQQPYQESVGRPLLSYSFFEASDPADRGEERQDGPTAEDVDDSGARVNIWSLSDPSFKELLPIALSSADLSRTVVVLGVDLTKPWTFDRALTTWSKVAADAVASKLKTLPAQQQEAVRQRQAAYLSQCYHGGSKPADASSYLPEGVLEVDVGVPVMVVGLKADQLQKGSSFEETQRQDFIQQHLRAFCLRHGAALLYCSATKDTNRLALQRYLLHRLYPEAFSFPTAKAQCETEQLLIPAGWDSKDLVSKLVSTKVPWPASASYSEVVVAPKAERDEAAARANSSRGDQQLDRSTPGGDASAASSFDDKPWLEELQQHLEAIGGVSEAKPTTYSQRKDEQAPSRLAPASESKPAPASSSGGGKAAGGGGSENAQIRNFFEGLLAKK